MKLGLGLGFSGGASGGFLRIDETSPSPQRVSNQPWMNVNNFSAIIEVVDDELSTTGSTRVIFYMGDSAGNNNQIYLAKASGDADVDIFITSGGASQGTASRVWEALRQGKKNRWGITSNNGTVSLFLNGILIDQFSGITGPVSATPEIGIGTKQGSNNWHDAINEFKFWDKAKSRTFMEENTRIDDIAVSPVFNADLNIIPVLGQSNAVGLGTGSNTYDNTDYMNMITPAGALAAYSDPADPNTDQLFPWYWDESAGTPGTGVQGELLDTLGGYYEEEYAVHTVARGGTGLVTDWNPLQINSGGVYRVSNYMFTCLQRLMMCKEHGTIRGYIWIQGERDAAESQTGAAYTGKLTELIDLLRYYIGDLPFICVSIHDTLPIGSYPTKAEIRAAQEDYNERDRYYVVAGEGNEVDTDEVHYTRAGYNTLGQALALSAAVNMIGALPPSFNTTPTITGDMGTGQELTCNIDIAGVPTPSVSYQWKMNGANVGTNSANYTQEAQYYGDTPTCVVTLTNDSGSAENTATGAAGEPLTDYASLFTFYWIAEDEGIADEGTTTTWTDQSGNNFDLTTLSSTTFTYDADTKGFRKTTSQSSIGALSAYYGTGASDAVTLIAFQKLDNPRSTATGHVMGLVSSAGAVAIGSNSDARYGNNQAGGVETAPGTYDLTDGVHMLAVRIDGDSTALFRVDDNTDVSFDPNDTWNNNSGIRFGSVNGTTVGPEGEWYAAIACDSSITNTVLGDIYTWATKQSWFI